MALTISIVLLVATGIFAGIAGNAWAKGGYHNAIVALWWGVAAYIIFGLGALLTYYSYVVKPTKLGVRPPQLVFLDPNLEPLAQGKPLVTKVLLRNTSETTAYHVRVYGQATLRDSSFKGEPTFISGQPRAEFNAEAIPAGRAAQLFLVVPKDIEFLQMTKERVDAINGGTQQLIVFGGAEYQDSVGNKYHLNYCFLYVPDAQHLVNCPTHYVPVQKDPKADSGNDEGRTMKDDEKSTHGNTTISRSIVNSPGASGNVLGNVSIHHHAPPARRITLAQANKMAPVLQPYAGSTLGIAYLGNNNEAFRYADDIARVFQHVGWDVENLGAWLGTAVHPGLTCEGKFPIAEAAAVVAAFREADLPIAQRHVKGWQEGKWQLVVGELLS